ncbi:MAG: response regulator, partial [Desulfobacterales bacterium]|nr:response regulator [Desulfobacterales bacterium]
SLMVSVSYLMDRNGKTIASSNRHDQDSFVGKKYSFRPYFKEAMHGNPAVYMALGVTSKKRGVYYSYPIYDSSQNSPIGVVVLKAGVDTIEREFMSLQHYRPEMITFITGPHGVVFMSDHKKFLYHLLWQVADEKLVEVLNSKQFGKGPWEWAGFKRKSENRVVDKAGNEYQMFQKTIEPLSGWNIVHLHNIRMFSKIIAAPFIGTIGYMILALCVLIGLSVFILYYMGKSDIISRKQAEEALLSEKLLSEEYINSLPGLFYVFDEQRFVRWNLEWKRITGYSDEELASRYGTDFFESEDRTLIGERMLKVFQEGAAGAEAELVTKDGRRIPYYFTGLRKKLNGKDHLIGLGIDITERKRLEEQLRQTLKMESIGTLAGGIAHDFNNILGIILGNIELAMDDVPEWNPAKFNLKEVRTASLRAKDVVRQLLSFARKTTLEKKPTNIIPIVKESLKLLRSSIPTSIEIRQNMTKDADAILADPTQINQILMNLCTNASHAMPDGGILEVSLKNVELDKDIAVLYPDLKPGQYVNLIVSDTGHGISQEEVDRIFDPYFTTKEIGKGTGLGLSVVHGIVKSHRGKISVDSEPKKGTTFSILFPVVEKERVVEAETVEKLPTGNERILFIDDEESMVYVGRNRLERLGYQVETKTSPVEALELFRANPDQFDLVITDMTMPQMTGDHLLEEVLKIRPDLPTIICSGFSEKIDEEKAKEIGIHQYIEKPFNRSDLAKLVRKVLDNKKKEQITGRVLVIEDEPQMRIMLKQMIEDIGCDVVEASDGKEGVKLYRANPFDLIVTDIIMPEKEGIETITELERDFPDVKIIAISGGGEIDAEIYLSMAKKLGARYTFAKPVVREELLKAIRQLLG